MQRTAPRSSLGACLSSELGLLPVLHGNSRLFRRLDLQPLTSDYANEIRAINRSRRMLSPDLTPVHVSVIAENIVAELSARIAGAR